MAKILVVDDASYIRHWCANALTRHGHHVLEAIDGPDAIAVYERERPDAVLLDVRLPLIDGLGVLRRLRQIHPEARVAMLTGMGQMETVVEARGAGAADFIVKPCPTARLIECIDRLLA